LRLFLVFSPSDGADGSDSIAAVAAAGCSTTGRPRLVSHRVPRKFGSFARKSGKLLRNLARVWLAATCLLLLRAGCALAALRPAALRPGLLRLLL
jgi:hypothetical protein